MMLLICMLCLTCLSVELDTPLCDDHLGDQIYLVVVYFKHLEVEPGVPPWLYIYYIWIYIYLLYLYSSIGAYTQINTMSLNESQRYIFEFTHTYERATIKVRMKSHKTLLMMRLVEFELVASAYYVRVTERTNWKPSRYLQYVNSNAQPEQLRILASIGVIELIEHYAPFASGTIGLYQRSRRRTIFFRTFCDDLRLIIDTGDATRQPSLTQLQEGKPECTYRCTFEEAVSLIREIKVKDDNAVLFHMMAFCIVKAQERARLA